MVTNTSMCISGIRYYIKSKAEKSRVVNPKNVITFIKWNKIVSYFIVVILIAEFSNEGYFTKIKMALLF